MNSVRATGSPRPALLLFLLLLLAGAGLLLVWYLLHPWRCAGRALSALHTRSLSPTPAAPHALALEQQQHSSSGSTGLPLA